MSLDNLRDLFHEQLKDIYSAEKQLTEALPKMVDAASDDNLRQAFKNHLNVTERQLERVRQLLDDMDVNPGNKKCKAMEGLVEEGSEMVKENGDATARDAGLICAAQKVEHYEIATYGSLRTWARMLGYTDIAQTLQSILDEEYDADNTLDKIAEGYLNSAAKA
ncbi:MAG: ferritin-like domain-containing protein [Anaerolineae bacterium]|nr:ferritin-like domain-containing protein [Anaerolineae bacterium]